MKNRTLGMAIAIALVSLGCPTTPSAPDAASDVALDAPSCVEDRDCDNGLFCDGPERCEAGRCVPGARPECDDAIACTRDICSEARRRCESSAPDEDGDGVGDAACVDARGEPIGSDCADEDPLRFPGNREVCDLEGHDEDCDPTTLGGRDADGDGHVDARCCNPDGARMRCGDDCDDAQRSTNPMSIEVCNGRDDDCSGAVDEGVSVRVFVDTDRDGWGDASRPMMACPAAAGVSTREGDCDDTRIDRNPGQSEICDSRDNDCDTRVDEAAAPVEWYRDSDGDLYGSSGSGRMTSCMPLAGYSLLDTDCNDSSRAVSPVATELCNGIDDNCNGVADYAIPTRSGDFEDDDGDGFLDPACAGPSSSLDCDDRDPDTGPRQVEVCDGRDNDCDETVDEGADGVLFYRDRDGDGYGSAVSGTLVGCASMGGFVARGGDCDDDEARGAAIHPGAAEVCDNRDNDCNGTADDAIDGLARPNADDVFCVAGRVMIGRCTPGFDNCDRSEANGCEADLRSAVHCGGCFRDCASLPGVESATCVPLGSGGMCGGPLTCESGRADCDRNAESGCEVDLSVDLMHCGACARRCNLARVVAPNCQAGACAIPAGSCELGWGDCNGLAMDGCEQDLRSPGDCGACGNECPSGRVCEPRFDPMTGSTTYSCIMPGTGGCTYPQLDCDGVAGCEVPNANTDAMNCGGCRRSCAGRPHVQSASCGAGTCQVGLCEPGWADCDGNFENGCEADLNSPRTCGQCRTDCTRLANVTGVSCSAGVCSSLGCSAGYGNCDGSIDNGCETNTTIDPANCGGCSMGPLDERRCDNQLNVTYGRCVGSACAPLVCDPGFADCNTTTPGCETNVLEDATNCGACGRSCGLGAMCEAGRCSGVRMIATGANHACALRESGQVLCWGAGGAGQLGNDSTGGSNLPVLVGPAGAPLANIIQITAGDAFSCALSASGQVWCWGAGARGQLGDGASVNASVPVQVMQTPILPLASIVRIASGADATCAIDGDGRGWCWGADRCGMLTGSPPGTGCETALPSAETRARLMPVISGTERVEHVAVGHAFVVAVLTNVVSSWGWFSNGTSLNYMASPRTIVEAAAGRAHVCFRTSTGAVVCAGENNQGQLGLPLGIPRTSMPGSAGFSVAQGLRLFGDTTCIVGSFDQVRCVGHNSYGQAGIAGAMSPLVTPEAVPLTMGASTTLRARASSLTSSGVAGESNCVVESTGRPVCWGSGGAGQLGHGVAGNSPYPVTVAQVGW